MIQLTAEPNVVARWIEAKDSNLRASLRLGFERISVMLQPTIQRKLSGEVLHHRSGKLIRSVHGKVEESDRQISAIVQAGALAPYGAVHEYGGTFTIPEHMSASRLGIRFIVRQHQATFPERSFMRSSQDENQQAILDVIRKSVQDGLAA